MPLQEAMHFLRQLLAYSFGRCNVFDARFAQPLDRAKPAQEKVFPVLAHSWTIVEDALPDPLFHQELVIGVGKTVRFIANALE